MRQNHFIRQIDFTRFQAFFHFCRLLSLASLGEWERALRTLPVSLPQQSPLSHSMAVTNQPCHPIVGSTDIYTLPQAASHSRVHLGPTVGKVQMHRQ